MRKVRGCGNHPDIYLFNTPPLVRKSLKTSVVCITQTRVAKREGIRSDVGKLLGN